MDVALLSACLTDECASLEHLVFKLEEEHLVLASGRHRFLPQASAEVQSALAALDDAERQRAQLTSLIVDELGLGAEATLTTIADAVEGPEAGTLRSHRQVMRALLARVQDLVERNRELIVRGVVATADALALLGAAPVYDERGTVPSSLSSSVVIDTRA